MIKKLLRRLGLDPSWNAATEFIVVAPGYFPDAIVTVERPRWGDPSFLWGRINTTGPYDEAYSRFERLDEEWYAELPIRATANFNIDLRFVNVEDLAFFETGLPGSIPADSVLMVAK